MKQTLSQHERLSHKREFDRLFQRGKVFRTPIVIIRALPNGLGASRIGISVGRRAGNAVRRNRIKRLLREAYRLNKPVLSLPCDIVIVPRPGWQDLSLKVVEPILKKVLAEIHEVFDAG